MRYTCYDDKCNYPDLIKHLQMLKGLPFVFTSHDGFITIDSAQTTPALSYSGLMTLASLNAMRHGEWAAVEFDGNGNITRVER